MTPPLDFDGLKGALARRIDQLPDHRQPGPNTRYRIKDAALGAFGVFYMQSPSFLAHQKHIQQSKGQNNARTLLGVTDMPCGPRWDPVLFLQHHPLPELSQASNHKRSNPVLSHGHYAGDRVPGALRGDRLAA
jgi:hypothetical protein